MKKPSETLPPGQRERADFPRFGVFARRFPQHPERAGVKIGGEVQCAVNVDAALHALPRVTQVSDFHCVTTWTRRSLDWSGYLFRDFFERVVVPMAAPANGVHTVVLRCQDGYSTSLPLEDALAEDVLLADRLDGAPLSIAHGAPLRFVAPAHYGYKNAKHVSAIEFRGGEYRHRPIIPAFMDHPRARVALEERACGVPGRWLRQVYRLSIPFTVASHARALHRYLAARAKSGHPPQER